MSQKYLKIEKTEELTYMLSQLKKFYPGKSEVEIIMQIAINKAEAIKNSSA